MGKKHHPQTKRWLSFSSVFGLAFIIGVPSYFAYILFNGAKREAALSTASTTTNAVIINKKNFFGNSPVSRQFSYSYSFIANGRLYTGNSKDPNYKIGDSIRVRYALGTPEYNEAIISLKSAK